MLLQGQRRSPGQQPHQAHKPTRPTIHLPVCLLCCTARRPSSRCVVLIRTCSNSCEGTAAQHSTHQASLLLGRTRSATNFPPALLSHPSHTHTPLQKVKDKGYNDGIIELRPDKSASLLDTAGKVRGRGVCVAGGKLGGKTGVGVSVVVCKHTVWTTQPGVMAFQFHMTARVSAFKQVKVQAYRVSSHKHIVSLHSLHLCLPACTTTLMHTPKHHHRL